jgi:8-oxo-dGTP diphosphatase
MKSPARTRKIPKFDRPLTTVDVVIFAVINDALRVLLVKRMAQPDEPFPEHWALPGGFVDTSLDRSLEACALRKLREKTGMSRVYLEQLGSWGSRDRDPRGWSATHAYFSLIPAPSYDDVVAGANSADVAWFKVSDRRAEIESKMPMAFDHGSIVTAAIERLRSKVEYTSLPAYLVDKEFTLSELQRAYEIVLGRPLDKSSFRTRVLAADLVVEVLGVRGGQNRPAQLYRLRSSANPVFFPRTFRSA